MSPFLVLQGCPFFFCVPSPVPPATLFPLALSDNPTQEHGALLPTPAGGYTGGTCVRSTSIDLFQLTYALLASLASLPAALPCPPRARTAGAFMPGKGVDDRGREMFYSDLERDPTSRERTVNRARMA